MKDGRVQVVDLGFRVLQKLVCSVQYGTRRNLWQDNVVVAADLETSQTDGDFTRTLPKKARTEILPSRKGTYKEGQDMLDLWFARALAFLNVSSKRGRFSQGEQLVVVRYYEIVDGGEYNAVDKELGGIRLRWAIDEHGDPWIDVVPASALRGRVHIVPDIGLRRERPSVKGSPTVCKNLEGFQKGPGERPRLSSNHEIYWDELFGDNHSSGLDEEAVFADSDNWKFRYFYVNRFKTQDSSEILYHVKDRQNIFAELGVTTEINGTSYD